MKMSGFVRIIVDKDDIRYSSRINASTACFINSNHHLWNYSWDGFKDVLSFYEADKQDKLTDETLSEHYGTLYINWNRKEIHQVQSDYYFNGFYISSLSLDLKGRILYGSELPNDHYEINNFLLNLSNVNTSKEIDCYCQDGDQSFDFKIYFNKTVNTEAVVNVIKDYRKIENDISILKDYHLESNIDLDIIKDKLITIVMFPATNKNWQTFKYDYDFKNGVKLTKQILESQLN